MDEVVPGEVYELVPGSVLEGRRLCQVPGGDMYWCWGHSKDDETRIPLFEYYRPGAGYH